MVMSENGVYQKIFKKCVVQLENCNKPLDFEVSYFQTNPYFCLRVIYTNSHRNNC